MPTKQELIARQDALLAVYQEVSDELMQLPGVQSVGVGLKETGGKLTDQIAFRVYVEEKKDPQTLLAEHYIPATIKGFQTDVLQAFDLRQNEGFVERREIEEHRPLQGGITIMTKAMSEVVSILGAKGEVGTLGWFARTKSDNKRVILTNCHVLYPDIEPDPLDPIVRTEVDKLAQPIYKHSCCCECNVIGQTIIGLKNEFVDCGIAYINDDVPWNLFINNKNTTQTLRVDGTAVAAVGDMVRKIGGRSAYTEGIVIDIGAGPKGSEFLMPNGQKTHTRVHQMVIWPANSETYIDDGFGGFAFFNEGDSGSVILDSHNNIVGLGYASHPLPNHSLCIANHIDNVLQHLKDHGHEIILEKSPPGGGDPPVFAIRGVRTLNDLLADCPPLLNELVEKHRREVSDLIEHCRPVTVAWRRKQGPGFAAAMVRSNREPDFRIPREMGGISRRELLETLLRALKKNGSEALRNDLQTHGSAVIAALTQGSTVKSMLALMQKAPSETLQT